MAARSENRVDRRAVPLPANRTASIFTDSRSKGSVRPSCQQVETYLVEIREREHRLRSSQVLRQASVPHLRKSPELLDDPEGMLTSCPRPRSCSIDPPPSLAQRMLRLGPPVHPIAHPTRLEGLSIPFLPVRLIAEDLPLLPVKQLRKLRDVGSCRVRHPYRVNNPAPVRPDVELHAEVPALPLARLLHLRIARLAGIFRRARRRDDRCVHDRPRAQQQPLLFQQGPDLRENSFGQPVLLEKVTKPKDRRLVGYDVLAQVNTREAPHRFTVVDRVLGCRVGKVEPLLQEVDSQHLLQAERLATRTCLGVVRLNPGDQALPGDHRVHLRKEPLAPGNLSLLVPSDRGERTLITHHHTPSPVNRYCSLTRNRSTCADLP